ncbi:MAG TPA: 4a-hydroxytetrahydrobiopterin dehydratase [Candidatus Paceibacterota bacterium]|nr:4a-hydroxytetrahydrobiopterin dehydratase [Candidatus Paceibacterota bacterium]HQG58464.1 4a-hydroxytetrahydrobiopterin dehydratase [bacterium]HOH11561.1 4a-hydroxytetrahydrobiopterin dehydratase [Candidatus Paceibacterota bacterium]HPI24558.1 4a-hydroxytetrahydrobiopterin dehydratase [Candidatus Paceibacterota bacterium]HPN89422.1 4a-hydroxytetrahydrobiopterin dehydratase [Candidatus Paceibacterota bacterium]
MDNYKLKPLPDTEINERLKSMPGWTYKDNKINKEFSFPTFADAVSFIDNLAPFCDKIDHHPDIHIFYKKILFELQRFDIGAKVTEKDFITAHEIERLYSSSDSGSK